MSRLLNGGRRRTGERTVKSCLTRHPYKGHPLNQSGSKLPHSKVAASIFFTGF
jgi:hypothetical protein